MKPWILFALIVTVHGGCQDDFGDYLQCIKEHLDEDYEGFEEEFYGDTKAIARECFASSQSEAISDKMCALSDKKLNADAFGRKGPLRGCGLCLNLSRFLKDSIFHGSEEAGKCVRKLVGQALNREITKCIKKKVDFPVKQKELPDFDEAAHPIREKTTNTVGLFVIINNRIASCRRSEANYNGTTKCMAKGKGSGDYLDGHCKTMKKCEKRVTSKCHSKFAKVEKATCECIEEKRIQAKSVIVEINQFLREVVVISHNERVNEKAGVDPPKCDAKCQCVKGIEEKIDKIEVDWKEEFSKAMSQCLDFPPSLTKFETLVRFGCGKLVEVEGKKETSRLAKDLATVFNFVESMIDAIVQRVTRFCRGDNCPKK